jgi:hypothetical protein
MMATPILHNSCALAATAAEARFRIDAKPQVPRSSRVVGLDPGAVAIIRELATRAWRGARFLTLPGRAGPGRGPATGLAAGLADIEFDANGRGRVRLRDELTGADFVLMIATGNDGAVAASAIGTACAERGITTAGVVIGNGRDGAGAVTALRPYARVLLVTDDPQDIAEILAAVGG